MFEGNENVKPVSKEQEKIEAADNACKLAWEELSKNGLLDKDQKAIGADWMKRLLAAKYDFAYTDPESPHFGNLERMALGPAEDIYSGRVGDLADKLNSVGIEVEITDINEINRKLEALEKRPRIGLGKSQKRYEAEKAMLEALKHNVVLRSQIPMSEEEKEAAIKSNSRPIA